MRRPLVAGNWKMHGTKQRVGFLLTELRQNCEKVEAAELAVLVPYVFSQTEELLLRSQIVWGAQNVSPEAEGAFTGEISASMLAEFNCTYVLVGHSERRQLYHETNELVARKFHAAKQVGIKPILCVGETELEREAGETLQVIQEQLDAVFKLGDNLIDAESAVVAYEPVWAIGTGKQATGEQAQEVHAFIRHHLVSKDEKYGKMRILYGGSVKPENAAEIFAMPDVDGGLIGGASLNAESFLKIGMLCNNSL